MTTRNSTSIEGLRLLVVEDDADTRSGLASALELMGAEVVAVGSKREAIDVLEGVAPDALVSDIGLPDGDGCELIRHVRAREKGRGVHLPAMALTAFVGDDDRIGALNAGFDLYVAKPAEPAMIATAVSRMVLRGPKTRPVPIGAAGPRDSGERKLQVAPNPPSPRAASSAASEGRIRTIFIGIIGVVVAVAALQLAQDFLIPIILGGVLSSALEPIVRALVAIHIPRPLAAALVLLLTVGGIGFTVYMVSDEAAAVANRLPVAARELREAIRRQRTAGASPMQAVDAFAKELDRGAAEASVPPAAPPGVVRVQVEEKPLDLRGLLWKGSVGAMTVGTNAILLLFLTYFLMASGDLFKRQIVAIAGTTPARKQVTLEVLNDVSSTIQSFLFIQLVTGAVVAVLSWAAFRYLGLENAAVWGLAAGVLNVIPYFGPLLVMAGLFVAGMLQFGSVGTVAVVLAASLVITGLEGFVLRPVLVSRAAGMNDVAVFVSLLFWGWLWGIVGMLLAVPLMMFVKSVCDRVDALAPVGLLLGDERPPL